jgi:hypothetical protein
MASKGQIKKKVKKNCDSAKEAKTKKNWKGKVRTIGYRRK